MYDTLGRLRSVTHDSQTASYNYDAAGLRFKRVEGTTTTYTMYTGNAILLQEQYSGSKLVETRFNLVRQGVIFAQVRKEGTADPVWAFFGHDHLGSQRVVWNADGSVRVKFSYSAWGEYTRNGGSASDEYLASFTGKEYDATGLLYFNARYYDPLTGRFLTEDPSRQGVNWYAYCGDNPVNRTDPTGRRTGETDFDTAYRGSTANYAGSGVGGGQRGGQAGTAPVPPTVTSIASPKEPALVPAPPGSDVFFIPPPSQPEQDNRFQVGLGLSGNLLSLGGALGLTTSGPYAGSQEVHGALFGFSGDLTLSAKGNTEISIGAGFLSKYLLVGIILDNPDVGFARFRGINVHVGVGVGLPYTVSKELP